MICFRFEVGGGSHSIGGSIKVSLLCLGFSWYGLTSGCLGLTGGGGGGLVHGAGGGGGGLGAGIGLRAGIGLGGAGIGGGLAHGSRIKAINSAFFNLE